MSEIQKSNSSTGNFAVGMMASIGRVVNTAESKLTSGAKAVEKTLSNGASAVRDSVTLGNINRSLDAGVTKMKEMRQKTLAKTCPDTTEKGLGVLGGGVNIYSGIQSIASANSLTDKALWKGITGVAGGAADVVISAGEMAGKDVSKNLKFGGKALGFAGAAFDAHDAFVAARNGNSVAAVESGLDAFAGAASATGTPVGAAFGVPYTATRALMKGTGGDEKVTSYLHQYTPGAIAEGAVSELRQKDINRFASFSNQGDLNRQVSLDRRTAVAARVEARELVKTATGAEKARLERVLKELNAGLSYATEREAEYKGIA